MYRVIIYGCQDKFSVAARGKEFNRRGLIRFLSRHANKLVGCEDVTVKHGDGPEWSVNFVYVGKKHLSDRIPTNRIFHP